jgi:hypothetical protein
LRFYAAGGRMNDWIAPEMIIAAPNIQQQDFDDVEAFLHTLTGTLPENAGPPEEH